MFYRQRMHFFPKTQEAWIELMRLGDEFNKLAVERGWAEGTFWMPVAGETEVVAEFDYPDVVAFEQANSFYNDPEMMAIGGKIWAVDSVRPPYTELLSTMPSFG